MNRFQLSEIQAQAILDMQLKRLQGLERTSSWQNTRKLKKKLLITRKFWEISV